MTRSARGLHRFLHASVPVLEGGSAKPVQQQPLICLELLAFCTGCTGRTGFEK
jgi:hypothetical protein